MIFFFLRDKSYPQMGEGQENTNSYLSFACEWTWLEFELGYTISYSVQLSIMPPSHPIEITKENSDDNGCHQ